MDAAPLLLSLSKDGAQGQTEHQQESRKQISLILDFHSKPHTFLE